MRTTRRSRARRSERRVLADARDEGGADDRRSRRRSSRSGRTPTGVASRRRGAGELDDEHREARGVTRSSQSPHRSSTPRTSENDRVHGDRRDTASRRRSLLAANRRARPGALTVTVDSGDERDRRRGAARKVARLVRWPVDRLGGLARGVATALPRAIEDLFRDRCTQYAASIAYRVLFSLFPLTIFLVSIFGLVLQDDELRQKVIDELVDILPVSESGQTNVAESIEGIATPLSAIGFISLIALFWGASGMMASIRIGLEAALKVDRGRPSRARSSSTSPSSRSPGCSSSSSSGSRVRRLLRPARRPDLGGHRRHGAVGLGAPERPAAPARRLDGVAPVPLRPGCEVAPARVRSRARPHRARHLGRDEGARVRLRRLLALQPHLRVARGRDDVPLLRLRRRPDPAPRRRVRLCVVTAAGPPGPPLRAQVTGFFRGLFVHHDEDRADGARRRRSAADPRANGRARLAAAHVRGDGR